MKLAEMKARLAAIVAKMQELNGVENLQAEQISEVNALSEEYDTLTAKIEAAEKMEKITAKADVAVRKTEASPVAARVEVVAESRKDKMGGFNSMGEFLIAVKNKAQGNLDKRFQNSMFEKNAEDGGILVPEEMVSSISKKFGEEESLLAKTTQFKVSGNNLTLLTDESAPWTGGVQAYWTAEGAPITESKGKIGQASLKLHKMAAMVKVTDELLEDATALESFMVQMAPRAMVSKTNSAIISGDGVGKPQGILNSGFKLMVNKESGQAADTVKAENIVKMYSRMIPSSRGQAAWFINPAVEEQLRLLKDGLGNYIYLAAGSQMNNQPYAQLLGRPVIPMLGALPALGDEGDIIFADLSYYYTITKTGGIKQAVSTHLYFDQDVQAYKWTFRIDGGCPFKTPVTTEFGNYQMSGIVTLEAR
jgi:HK97 family phage major capsid protein